MGAWANDRGCKASHTAPGSQNPSLPLFRWGGRSAPRGMVPEYFSRTNIECRQVSFPHADVTIGDTASPSMGPRTALVCVMRNLQNFDEKGARKIQYNTIQYRHSHTDSQAWVLKHVRTIRPDGRQYAGGATTQRRSCCVLRLSVTYLSRKCNTRPVSTRLRQEAARLVHPDSAPGSLVGRSSVSCAKCVCVDAFLQE